MEIYPGQLRCNGLENPLGTPCDSLGFTWKILGDGQNVQQVRYRLQISSAAGFDETDIIYNVTKDMWEQRFVLEEALAEKTTYYWRVQLLVTSGEHGSGGWTPWSVASTFETAFADTGSWKAQWIEAGEDFYKDADVTCKNFWKRKKDLFSFPGIEEKDPEGYPKKDQGLRRPPYFYREFCLKKTVKKARIYISAHGSYTLQVNEKIFGRRTIAPDFTAYDKCIYYQTYDVTDALKTGGNRLNIPVADGWYAGHSQGIPGLNHLYGEHPALIMQMEITYTDGSCETIVSDGQFEARNGELLYADPFLGEYLDLTQDCGQNSRAEAPQTYKTVSMEYSRNVLTPQKGALVEAVAQVDAVSVKALSEGTYIVDFGRTLAGRESLIFEGDEGCTIRIEHSEALGENGDLQNVIGFFPFHDQCNSIKIGDEATYTYEPQFTFQGFRYIKVSGVKSELRREHCRTYILSTAMERTGQFECSNVLLNRLTENAFCSQQSNMLSIPTDCPQRERGGFTGDAQVFAPTAAWHQDVSEFFRRWLEQCRLEQLDRGQIPIVVPYTKAYSEGAPNPGWTSAGWGDAIVFVPWDMYMAYGDIRFLEDNYSAMEKWMEYVRVCAEETMPEQYYMDYERRSVQKYLWNTGYHWGDWLMPGYSDNDGVAASKEITASLYYFREVVTMEKVTKALEMANRCDYYSSLKAHIRDAFHKTYITEDGRLTNELQGLYVMALAFGIVDGRLREQFAARLDELVKAAGDHLQTGFLSTPFLLDVLWDNGYRDTAFAVLYQDTCPSWLYEVKMGATTIWEAWDAVGPDGKIKFGVSFNHYAYGCVCDFIYRKISGIVPLEPGFRSVKIAPEMIRELDFAQMSYETVYGLLKVRWDKTVDGIRYDLEIPHGMTALVDTGNGIKTLGSGHWKI